VKDGDVIKLLALDLDGTLVHEDLKISARTIEAISRAQTEANVKVVIATGRMFLSTVYFAELFQLRGPVISYQGAMIRDLTLPAANVLDYPILYERGLELEHATSVIDYIETQGFHANVYIKDRLYTTRYNPHLAYYQKISGVEPIQCDSFFDILHEAPTKIMVIDEKAPEIMSHLNTTFGEALHVCLSRRDFCEIVHGQVSKWQALQVLMAQWGIQAEDVMAIGDQGNDIPMLQGAGLGIAMGNAPDSVQALANAVTGSIDEDGAAQAIERYILS
jgi:Cof subfamily protein (haloacid dehalogenase superfamily)